MRSVSLAKPLIIMMVGLPGAGKSFFAKQFSDTFGAPLISYDQLAVAVFPEYQHSNDEQATVARVMTLLIEEFVKTKKTLLIDGGLQTRAERASLRQFARKNGYETLVIWVQTDTATCRLRAVKRSSRTGSLNLSRPISPEQFESVAKRFSIPLVQENVIVISGKHTYPAQARTVLRRLAGPAESTPAANTIKPRSIAVRDTELPLPPRGSIKIT